MSKTVTIAHNATIARLINPSKALCDLVSDLLSYEVEMETRSTMFNYKNQTFAAGFVRLVQVRLERRGYSVILKKKARPEPLGPVHPIVDDFGDDPRYDYQRQTVDRLVRYGGMIGKLATGAGKSRVFKLCAARLGLPTLFVTTQKSLMYQMAESYKESMGCSDVGVLGDGKWSPKPDGVNFAITDTIASRLSPFDLNQQTGKAIAKIQDKIDTETNLILKKLGLPTETLKLARKVPPDIVKQVRSIRASVESRYQEYFKKVEVDISKKRVKHEKERQQTLDLLKQVGFLCLEEAHEVGSDSFFRVSQACTNAHYRLALTATPFMRDSEEANMRLMGATGPIGIEVSEKLLIDRGILAKPYFCFESTVKPPKLYERSQWQAAYTAGIVANAWRNNRILSHVMEAKRFGLTSMVLVVRSQHGETIKALMEQAGLRVAFIFGSHKQEVRKKALQQLKDGELDCLIGSTILDVGVDVPSVGLIAIAGGGKAEVGMRQRIGRGLRAKKHGPNVCLVVDFRDEHNKILRRHAKEREQIVRETKGFGENVVSSFNYEALGFVSTP